MDDLAAFGRAASQEGATVAAEALIGMPSLAPLLAGKPHSEYVVHKDNPNEL